MTKKLEKLLKVVYIFTFNYELTSATACYDKVPGMILSYFFILKIIRNKKTPPFHDFKKICMFI